MSVRGLTAIILGGVFVLLGIALLVVTSANGGGAVGFLLGGLFVVVGVARIVIERKIMQRRRDG